ncbi:cyclic dehypoxanthinyl futalosine synthase [Acetohalobium arabaticum]|uniref:Cyclic dehypoxanthine futalosine synthase n=1 Tax=Acetohalobium arabaticum (strain ATCC 49924 / DSM 5501 / Z-7288) TaxID=574087 RepID=D9QUZ6_ACEAZ|nr:cyclic dehypoxanthinyl futalosine synthase [Acetohalobium arabaticum]ADL12055.1 Radical SAM domain protein [Acetohalobium arabaticum DSM 5501]
MAEVKDILAKAQQDKRLTLAEGVKLLASDKLLAIGKAADRVRRRLHSENKVTFAIDRNINYTNVCEAGCKFCAFYQQLNDSEAYLLEHDEIFRKIEETIELGGTQILMQGGLHPKLDIDYYLELFRAIKERFKIHLHSLSPPEIAYIAQQSNLTLKETLTRLQQAGLDSLPGGGAEMLVDRVREEISPNKVTSDEWLEVMQTAHEIGMRSTATMMFGSIETLADRIEHLIKIRKLQDKTGGFTAFIPWAFQPTNTALEDHPKVSKVTGSEYLKMVAVARIVLDNVDNIQASWVTQGAKVAQVSLEFGVNDFGSTMIEENVVKAAGASYRVPLEKIVELIKDTGRRPVQRNTLYQELKGY